MPAKEHYVKTRVSALTKKKADKIVGKLGLDMSSYLRICIHQLIQSKALPFQPHLESHCTDVEDIILPSKKRSAILDYIDEE